MKQLTVIVFVLAFLAACNNKPQNKTANTTEADSLQLEKDKEAREDSLKFAEALELQSKFEFSVTADLETPPVPSEEGADAADDPAIWLNAKNPEKSLILGTNKKAGLHAYNLQGKELSFVKCGKINNIDLRDGFEYQGKEVVLVAGSNRTTNTVSMFVIDKETLVLSDSILNIPSKVDDVYGISMYHDQKNNEFYVVVNGKDGNFEQYKVFCQKDEGLSYQQVRTFKTNSQPEGIVADDENQMLYIGVEEEGIYKISANPESTDTLTLIANTSAESTHITYDIEGLALFHYNEKQYLLASVQGSFSYAIYSLGDTEKYVGSFVIKNGTVDGVEETDGLEALTTDLLPGFEKGLMVMQDGFNYDGDSIVNQNFKYVSLKKIEALLQK